MGVTSRQAEKSCASALLALESGLLLDFQRWQDDSGFPPPLRQFHADLILSLELLRSRLQYGQRPPLQAYLNWLGSTLDARKVAPDELSRALDWLQRYLMQKMSPEQSRCVLPLLQISCSTTEIDVWPESEDFEKAVLAGDQAGAIAVMDAALTRNTLINAEAHIIRPALYRIGERWRAGEISVAQEHLATAICQLVMTMGLLRSPARKPLKRRVLLACVDGNQHALGLRAIADRFHLQGWDVQYLGASVPTRDLLTQVERWQPHLLGLSVSLPQQLAVVHAIIGALRERYGPERPAATFGGFGILAPVHYRLTSDAKGSHSSPEMEAL